MFAFPGKWMPAKSFNVRCAGAEFVTAEGRQLKPASLANLPHFYWDALVGGNGIMPGFYKTMTTESCRLLRSGVMNSANRVSPPFRHHV
jgi:hypothetical protein